jgi:D-glycero-D-manno-heptose 1,7-bisphosphate phosphatase
LPRVNERLRRRAALLDRDGTIIVDAHYPSDPGRVALLPGAAEAIRLLANAGVPSVVCSNQSGIARGLVTLEQYRAVRLRVAELLRHEGAELLDTFICPHHPDFDGPCSCRKPSVLLFQQAAALHGLDLHRSMFVGDKYRDVAPAAQYHASGFLIRGPETSDEDVTRATAANASVVASLLDAAKQFLDRSSLRRSAPPVGVPQIQFVDRSSLRSSAPSVGVPHDQPPERAP